MAGITTSKVTSSAPNTDLELAPDGAGQIILSSMENANPGQAAGSKVTIISLDSSTNAFKDLDVLSLTTKTSLDEDDLLMVHDSTTGQVKKVPNKSI